MPIYTQTRLAALNVAITQIGVKEEPPGSNTGPQVKKYLISVGLGPNPWCLAFVHWCYRQCGITLAGYGLVQAFDEWAAKNGKIVTRPFRGDIICYDWNNDHWDDHVGIVDKVLSLSFSGRSFTGFVRTVEGNTAVGNDSNGGQVMYRYRWCRGFGVRFARIPGSVKS